MKTANIHTSREAWLRAATDELPVCPINPEHGLLVCARPEDGDEEETERKT